MDEFLHFYEVTYNKTIARIRITCQGDKLNKVYLTFLFGDSDRSNKLQLLLIGKLYNQRYLKNDKKSW